MSIISKQKTTYYIQYRKKDGTLTPRKKLYKSTFNGWLHFRWGKTYKVNETHSYADAEIYIAEPYIKPEKTKAEPNYIRFRRKDGSPGRRRKVLPFDPRVSFLRVGSMYLRWGFVPYQCTEEWEHGRYSSTYVLERY